MLISMNRNEERNAEMPKKVVWWGATHFFSIHSTGGARIRVPVRSMNSESEYRIPIQSFMRDSFD